MCNKRALPLLNVKRYSDREILLLEFISTMPSYLNNPMVLFLYAN